MPPLSGLLESALYVADLDRAAAFYTRLLGADILLADRRMRALGVAGRQVLLLFLVGASDRGSQVPGGFIPPHDGRGQLHLAFAIPADSLGEWESHLAAMGVAVESRVHAPRGGTSLYFRDPDDNLVELATPGLWTIY